MKITVSGWAGAGSSSLAMILANALNYKLIQGSGVFRYIFKKLEFSTTGADRNKAHSFVEPYFGPIYDKFVDTLLKNNEETHFIVDSDIASFRIGKTKDIFSIFLIANRETRVKRTRGDNRPEDGEIMDIIDLEHQKIYRELHNIDVLDLTEIRSKHQLVLDNSNITIAEELKTIFSELVKFNSEQKTLYSNLIPLVEKLDKEFWSHGKNEIVKQLTDKDLIPDPELLLGQIGTMFKKEISTFPVELRSIIQDTI